MARIRRSLIGRTVVNHEHVEAVLKARRQLCVGEGFRVEDRRT